MAIHHVSLRRLCPSLFGQLTPSPGECDLKVNPTQAERTGSNGALAFIQASDLAWNGQTRLGWEGASVLSTILSQANTTGNGRRTVTVLAGGVAFSPIAKAQGLPR
jgi:hypothetical protein